MSETSTAMLTQLGIGGAGGFLIGFAVKKMAKVLAVIVGFLLLLGLYLAQGRVISVNYQRVTELVSGFLPQLEGFQNILLGVAANLPFAGSFILGFLLGVRKS